MSNTADQHSADKATSARESRTVAAGEPEANEGAVSFSVAVAHFSELSAADALVGKVTLASDRKHNDVDETSLDQCWVGYCPDAADVAWVERGGASDDAVPLDDAPPSQVIWIVVCAKDLVFAEDAKFVGNAKEVDALVDSDPGLPLELPQQGRLQELDRVSHEGIGTEASGEQLLDGELSSETRVTSFSCVRKGEGWASRASPQSRASAGC